MTCFSTKKADNKVMRYTFTQTPRKLKFITKINGSRDKKAAMGQYISQNPLEFCSAPFFKASKYENLTQATGFC